jgi:hypothetical protein
MSLAMAVLVWHQMPKVLRRHREPEHRALDSATGY